MRRRGSDEATAAARRRLELLEVELAGLARSRDAGPAEDDSSLLAPEPVPAGPPASLLGEREVLYAPVGRPLAPEPVRVRAPGRHASGRRDEPDGPGGLVAALPAAVRSRVGLTGQHLLVLVGVAGLALALAGWVVLHGRGSGEAVPRASFTATGARPVDASGPGSSGSPAASGSASGSPGSGTVVVDVTGKVRRPGIVTLPVGSRVDDALRKAGGVRPGAHLGPVNLARVLVDGEQIVVGQPAPVGTAPSAAGGASAPAGALVNLNTAGLTELDSLPGVGPVTAQKILDWRTAHGSFSAVDELLEVDGIGDKTLADIAPRVTL